MFDSQYCEDFNYDDDNNDFELDEQKENLAEDSAVKSGGDFFDSFLINAHLCALDYIDAFFKDREMHYGGPIPNDILHSPYYVSIVLNTDICKGSDRVYEAIACSDDDDFDSVDAEFPEDIQFLVGMLEECASLNIPKCFATGITLMYLELCMGIEI